MGRGNVSHEIDELSFGMPSEDLQFARGNLVSDTSDVASSQPRIGSDLHREVPRDCQLQRYVASNTHVENPKTRTIRRSDHAHAC